MDKRLVLLALTTLFVAAEVCAQMPGCFLWNNVMVVPKNPLTAKFVSRKVWYLHDGREVIEEMQGTVARDSLGRTYGEAHVTRSPARDPNVRISSIQPSVSVSGTDRRPVKILPLSKLAHVNTDPTAACRPRTFEGDDKGDATLFDGMTSSPWFPSNAVLDDLGFKDVDGVVAHGFRQTFLGEKDEVEWAGRPVRIVEIWVSDELAVNVLEVETDPRGRKEVTIAFTNFRRDEPEASVFEIPPDYKIEKKP